jgi:hypothetical protein
MPNVAVLEALTRVDSMTMVATGVVTDQVSVKAPFRESFSGAVTDAIITARLRSVAASLTAQAGITLPIGQAIDLTAPPDPVPTPQQVFLQAYQQLQSGQRKITAGLLAADDKDVANLLATAKAAYDPAFVGIG